MGPRDGHDHHRPAHYNSPYEEPARHWRYERETRTFDLVEGRRPAGCVVASRDNYYEAFDIVPSALLDKLRQGKMLVRNWHALAWDGEEQIKKRRSVDRGSDGDTAV